MKNIKYLFFAFAITALFTSCEKFLDVKPENQVDITEGLKTENDLYQYLVSTYDVMRNGNVYGGTNRVIADVMADEAYSSSSTFEWTQVKTLSMNLFNPITRDMWTNSYLCVQRANVVIDYIDNKKITVSDANAKSWKAEAQFIRAVAYFQLVNFWGLPYDASTLSTPGVPLRVAPVYTNEFAATKVPRATVKEIYDFVTSQLREAETNLPVTQAKMGHATSYAASAMLAKAYFQMNKHDSAFYFADKLIGHYSLDADWNAKWARASMGTTTNEVIFMLISTSETDNSGSALQGSYRTDASATPTFGPTAVLEIALKEYATDVRSAQFTNVAGSNQTAGLFSKKYDYKNIDAPVINFNEILLIHAESGLESGQGDPTADLNLVQQRAGVPFTTGTLDNIRKERRKELSLEGYRLFDLKRTKQSVRGEAWNSKKLLFQIPDLEQNGNPDIVMN